MPIYNDALAGLNADEMLAVDAAFNSWTVEPELQVAKNIANETALTLANFTDLLRSFAIQIAAGHMSKICWETASRAHKLKGHQIPTPDCPAALGRARDLSDYATSISRTSSGGLTEIEAKKLLLKYSGSSTPTLLEPFLYETPLGNFYIWATFNQADFSVNPFDTLPATREGICTALGLGHVTASDTLIVLAWNHTESGSPPLYRPTVADAGNYPYFRPRPNAAATWGLTEPLDPNPTGLLPQPEVVMSEIIGQGLRLPFLVIQA
ncbi:MAG: hypothetical protein WCD79_03555 [Chthoniobacteraceae bacterium]